MSAKKSFPTVAQPVCTLCNFSLTLASNFAVTLQLVSGLSTVKRYLCVLRNSFGRCFFTVTQSVCTLCNFRCRFRHICSNVTVCFGYIYCEKDFACFCNSFCRCFLPFHSPFVNYAISIAVCRRICSNVTTCFGFAYCVTHYSRFLATVLVVLFCGCWGHGELLRYSPFFRQRSR